MTQGLRSSDATTILEYDDKETKGSKFRTMSVVGKRAYFMDDFQIGQNKDGLLEIEFPNPTQKNTFVDQNQKQEIFIKSEIISHSEDKFQKIMALDGITN